MPDGAPDDVAAPTPLPAPGQDAAAIPPPPKPRGSVRVRKIAVGFLVVLTSLAMLASILGVWAYRQVLNTDVFTTRVDSILQDPDVQASMATYVTDQVMGAINPDQLAKQYLPQVAQPLVAPLVAAIRNFVYNATLKVIASDQIQTILDKAVKLAHQSAVKLLEGEKVAGFNIQGNSVVFNTLPVIQQVITQVNQNGIFGHQVDIPPVVEGDSPSTQIQKLASALGVTLPADFGQIKVFSSDSLSQAQDALKLLKRGLILVLIVTLVLLVVTLLLSTNRWRTAAQLGIGLALVMILTRLITKRVDQRVLEIVQNPNNRPATKSIIGVFRDSLDSVALILIIVGLVVALIAFFLGRSDSAARLRAGAARSAARAGEMAKGHNPVTTFLIAHTDAARLISVVLGVLIMLWAGFSTGGIIVGLIVAAVLILVIELIVRRAGQQLADGEGSAAPPADAPPSDDDSGPSSGLPPSPPTGPPVDTPVG